MTIKLTQIHDLKVEVTILVGPNTCKGVIFHRDLRIMYERYVRLGAPLAPDVSETRHGLGRINERGLSLLVYC